MTARPAPVKVLWRSALLATDKDRREQGLPAGPPATARFVGAAMAENVNAEGEVWVSNATIVERTGLAERTVRNNLGVLEESGWLEVLVRGGMKDGPRTTHWKVTTPASPAGVRGDDPGISCRGEDDRPRHLVPATPASGSTTPASPAPESERTCTDEPGESVALVPRDTYDVDPFDSSRPTVFQMARNNVKLHPEEMDQYIEEAISLHGVSRVTEVVAALSDATSPNTYARQFDKKLTRALNAYQLQQVINAADPFVPANNVAPIDRPTGNTHTGCTTCKGSGWATPTDEHGEPTGEPVYRCPERHLKAVGA